MRATDVMAFCSSAPSPRKRGEGWGEGRPETQQWAEFGGRNSSVTRKLRYAPLPTSPRERGEVISRAINLTDLWPSAAVMR
jgi:hypothetical protein